MSFCGDSDGKEAACNAGDMSLIPRLGRSPGEGSGNPLQYSSLENSMDRGAWQATFHGIAELGTTERLTLSLYWDVIHIHYNLLIKWYSSVPFSILKSYAAITIINIFESYVLIDFRTYSLP